MWQRLRRAFQIRQLTAILTGFTAGLLVDLLSDWLGESGTGLVPVIVAVCVVGFLLSAWFWLRDPGRVGLRLEPVKTVRTEAEKQRTARRGMIACVSLYRPTGRSQAAELSPEEWRTAAEQLDYHALDLVNSNLAPTIDAITTHASRLEHCWLIGTSNTDPQVPGSGIYAPVLEAYLQQECGVECNIHYGSDLDVSLQDDALVFNRTVELMQIIFKEAEGLGLAPADMVADFTSGIRSMSLGIILACLDGDRDIQMIGTRYGADGRWTEDRFPIIFGFEPILRQE